ncbi:unnamed protein product [Rotaria sp. Silwood1]|nr:unnamed protein product [Rotaria sp. Silwood1]CAF0953283.1 unnamed protein product [Rotaria sp. Silwood1]CAF1117961.1 unnamed protein product [Rotaria sp. Silwood1]CAF3331096.1 unnamed protein product [Rotaria sp. Silwood1]CAF3340331.1 unnamed protein product [Rotaria sp. Silwood1]
MSFFSNSFAIKKTKPRKHVSRSPLKLPADEMFRELGPKYEIIDVKIADKKIIFDTENGDWNTAGAESVGGTASSGSAQKIRKQVEVLKEENNMLKLKVDVLLNLVAESVAELSPSQK